MFNVSLARATPESDSVKKGRIIASPKANQKRTPRAAPQAESPGDRRAGVGRCGVRTYVLSRMGMHTKRLYAWDTALGWLLSLHGCMKGTAALRL
jgi:hypothetical protein